MCTGQPSARRSSDSDLSGLSGTALVTTSPYAFINQ